MNRRKLVRAFYSLGFSADQKLEDMLHPDVNLEWNGTTGFKRLNYKEIVALVQELQRSYVSLRPEVSHLLREKDTITIRFTYFAKTIENPEEELPMAHFMVIWELKDGKLWRGFQISQLADEPNEDHKPLIP